MKSKWLKWILIAAVTAGLTVVGYSYYRLKTDPNFQEVCPIQKGGDKCLACSCCTKENHCLKCATPGQLCSGECSHSDKLAQNHR